MNSSEKIKRKDVWILAARHKTLPAAAGPVAVGTAVAAGEGGFHPLWALGALAGALLLQFAVNLGNDYFYGKREGEKSGGPFPIASGGLAEITVFIFFGLVAVCGTAYVQLLYLPLSAVIFAFPVGFLITAIISVTNLRDMGTDEKAGRKTVAVVLGPVKTRGLYSLLVFGAYAIPLFLWLSGGMPPVVMLPLISFPMAFVLVQEIWQVDGVILSDVLAGTVRLSPVFSLLLSMGIVAATY